MTYDPAASDPAAPGPQPRKDNTLKIVLIVVGIILLVGVLVCGGLIAMVYYGARGMVSTFQEEFAAEYEEQFRENPDVVAELGEVQEVDFSVMESMQANQDNQADDEPVMVFNIVGAEGRGKIHATLDPETNRFRSAVLIRPDGEEVPIDVSEIEPADPDGFEIERQDPAELETAEPLTEEPLEADEPVEVDADDQPVEADADEPVEAAP